MRIQPDTLFWISFLIALILAASAVLFLLSSHHVYYMADTALIGEINANHLGGLEQ